ncbi:MAG: hypothetical protein K0S74_251 [Chlamydiales bacterium]|nr:hypothetical protein [Chlamydiales bacterium]
MDSKNNTKWSVAKLLRYSFLAVICMIIVTSKNDPQDQFAFIFIVGGCLSAIYFMRRLVRRYTPDETQIDNQ